MHTMLQILKANMALFVTCNKAEKDPVLICGDKTYLCSLFIYYYIHEII